MNLGLLALADGTVLRGTSVGASGVATGELVFNTAMTGYQEIITDPSYAGQMITFTSPHIGNYGTTRLDEQGDVIHASGVIMRSISRVSSSWRSEVGLAEYLASRDVVALSDVDTRKLTRHIATSGSMPAAMGAEIDENELVAMARAAPSMAGRDLVSGVTTDTVYQVASEDARGSVVIYDFGVKRDIIASLTARGLSVTVVPATTAALDVLAMEPDGVFLSNGPGDPEPLVDAIASVRALLGRTPIFGICLGHQILGLALGLTTYKLPFGHHGGNHPVQDLAGGTVAITSQNHGFAVNLDPSATVESPFGSVQPTHQNLNDGTNEGLRCRDARAFSVQFHPEAAPGPRESLGLFDRFVDVIGGVHA
jgi:carbamoyl-phosphate synthase small subunit